MLSLADYRQDMQQNHMKFFESVQNFQMRPVSSSFSGSNFTQSIHPGCDFLGDDSHGRTRSGSGGCGFFKDDILMDIPTISSSNNNATMDDFPPISTFHVTSPSPRKHGSYQQGPPRSNRFRRGGNFRGRNENGSSRGEPHHSQSRSSKVRHDSYSSSEGANAFGTLTLQQQQAINNEAANGTNNADFAGRYKTELCRPFMENGECKYGDKCQFAHGRHELKQMSRHPKYKTEYCRTFHTVGFCPYGPRCHFLHLLDLDNPVQPGDESPQSSSDEQGGVEIAKQTTQMALAFHDSGRGDSISPTTIDEPAESVFMSPSPPAISPVSSLSTCSEAAHSSGIGLSSPNASVSSTSPSARTTNVVNDVTSNITSEQANQNNNSQSINEAEFPPLRQTLSNESTSSSNNSSVFHHHHASPLPVDRLHLLTISTEEMQVPNFAQLQQQQKRLQERCLALSNFYRRQNSAARAISSSLIQPARGFYNPANSNNQNTAGRRLPIFSSLAN